MKDIKDYPPPRKKDESWLITCNWSRKFNAKSKNITMTIPNTIVKFIHSLYVTIFCLIFFCVFVFLRRVIFLFCWFVDKMRNCVFFFLLLRFCVNKNFQHVTNKNILQRSNNNIIDYKLLEYVKNGIFPAERSWLFHDFRHGIWIFGENFYGMSVLQEMKYKLMFYTNLIKPQNMRFNDRPDYVLKTEEEINEWRSEYEKGNINISMPMIKNDCTFPKTNIRRVEWVVRVTKKPKPQRKKNKYKFPYSNLIYIGVATYEVKAQSIGRFSDDIPGICFFKVMLLLITTYFFFRFFCVFYC